MNHPSCIPCNAGFKDDAAYAEVKLLSKVENTFTYSFFPQHLAAEHPELECVACRRHFETAEDAQAHFTLSPAHPKCNDCGRGFKDEDALNAVSVILRCTLPHPNVFKKHRDSTDNPISLQAQLTEIDNDGLPLDDLVGDPSDPSSKVDKPLSGPGLVRKDLLFQDLLY